LSFLSSFFFFSSRDLSRDFRRGKRRRKETRRNAHLSQLAANVATSPCVAAPSNPCAASTASADAQTSAAEEESPEPKGTVPCTRTSSEHGVGGGVPPFDSRNSKTPLYPQTK